MKKILFLHGFFASGSCPMARALREAFDGQAHVLTPDLPLHPKEALKYIRMLIDKEKPDLLVGNSCGAFLAQMLSPVVGIPALLGNPHFKMTDFLKERIGEMMEQREQKPNLFGLYRVATEEDDNQYGIQSVPTLMLFRHGEVLWRTSGVVQKSELLATIDPFLK